MPLPGGIGETQEATEEIQRMVHEVEAALRGLVGMEKRDKLAPMRAISYKTQVVAGTNFFIKVAIDGGNEHIHLRLFKSLGAEPKYKLTSHQEGHNETSDIKYF